uniref:Response regulator transcription factor n=1 Tax=Thermorudis peleae TaxID=1382356 RepID=A0A831TFK5_9BACT
MSSSHGARILIVDDEPAIRRVLRANLEHHGFDVATAADGRTALNLTARWHPDLILLDLGLPDLDGLDIVKAVRARSNVPIIILSVRSAEREKVAALDLGADDYLTKPFGIAELLARIRVALRHAARPTQGAVPLVRAGEIEVDFESRRVTIQGREVRLTPTEYELLKVFLTHPNKVLTDRFLLQQVWGPEFSHADHYLHVYVARLRKKLEPDPQQPRYIRTEPGVGYRFTVDDLEAPMR